MVDNLNATAATNGIRRGSVFSARFRLIYETPAGPDRFRQDAETGCRTAQRGADFAAARLDKRAAPRHSATDNLESAGQLRGSWCPQPEQPKLTQRPRGIAAVAGSGHRARLGHAVQGLEHAFAPECLLVA